MARLRELHRTRNRFIGIFDLLGCAAALLLAYTVRFDAFAWPAGHVESFWRFLPISVVVKLVVIYTAGLYRRLWRHAGITELERITVATGISGAIGFALGVWVLPAVGYLNFRVPTSVAVLDAVLCAIVVIAPRFLIRWSASRGAEDHAAQRVLVAGAGAAGDLIARQLRANPKLGFIPVAFVDDDSGKHGLMLHGLPVAGSTEDLEPIGKRFQAKGLIVAMPTAPGTAIRRLVQTAAAAGLATRTIPGMFEILSGKVGVSTLRPIQIEDLLRRAPVRTDLDRVQEIVTGKRVLVTGAGGSIGSELCRQIASHQPSCLILLGHGENSIFNIAAELTGDYPSVEVVPLIADVRDRERIGRLVATWRPSIIFHAAAHKHVPLMEINSVEAITNNVLGTRNVCEAAVAAGVERFVMVSTDKAVRPTNVMGASKRVAEQLVQELGAANGSNFIAVRFGNVLGSRGSVVPIFLRQIEAGGPVTVTHPEMRRYFMTIPEAVQLVLQAAVLGRGGEVFVLDMGEPVKVVDLAHDLIRLSGLEAGRDIQIEFTGVRPGEKLFEELFFGREEAAPTGHPKILRARHTDLAPGLASQVGLLVDRACHGAPDTEIRALLRRLVPDYRPEDSIHDVEFTPDAVPAPAEESLVPEAGRT